MVSKCAIKDDGIINKKPVKTKIKKEINSYDVLYPLCGLSEPTGVEYHLILAV
jgi:hypothetical protein